MLLSQFYKATYNTKFPIKGLCSASCMVHCIGEMIFLASRLRGGAYKVLFYVCIQLCCDPAREVLACHVITDAKSFVSNVGASRDSTSNLLVRKVQIFTQVPATQL